MGSPAACGGVCFSSDAYLLCKRKSPLHRTDKVSSAARGNGSGTAFRGSDLYINYKVCQFRRPIYMEFVRSSSGTCTACRNHPEDLRGCFKPQCVKGPKPGFNGLVRLKRTITVIWFCFLCNTAEELHPLISASKPQLLLKLLHSFRKTLTLDLETESNAESTAFLSQMFQPLTTLAIKKAHFQGNFI